MKTLLSLVAVCPLLMAVANLASGAELGMKAPPLVIADWARGKPVDPDVASARKVVVVEFWATWCGPCKVSIPHLTELQKKYAKQGLVIIGVTDESMDEVKPFLKKMGSQMAYTVAIDKDKKTSDAYMKAFDEDGIPYAFIVDREGRIAWTGSPLEDFDEPLEQIVAGTYDLPKAIFSEKYHIKIHDYLHLASYGESPLAHAAGRNLLAEGAKYPDLLNDLAWEILTHEDDIKFRDKPLAVEAARAANAASGGKDSSILDTLARALFETDQGAEAVRVEKEAIRYCRDKELLAKFKSRLSGYEKLAK